MDCSLAGLPGPIHFETRRRVTGERAQIALATPGAGTQERASDPADVILKSVQHSTQLGGALVALGPRAFALLPVS
jgi:hypothetical protein